jgi:hypothetical protein
VSESASDCVEEVIEEWIMDEDGNREDEVEVVSLSVFPPLPPSFFS